MEDRGNKMNTEQAKVLYICLVLVVGMGIAFWMGLMMGRMGMELDSLEKRRAERDERR